MPSLAACLAAIAVLAASSANAHPTTFPTIGIAARTAPATTDAGPILGALSWGIANGWTGAPDDKKDAAAASSSLPSPENSKSPKKSAAASQSCPLSILKLPQGTAPLPPPNGTLAYVALGHGTQNYTCAASDAATKPVSIGALATLYDMSCPAARFSRAIALLAPLALAMPPASASPPPSSNTTSHAPSSSSSPSDADAGNSTDTLLGLPLLGHHFFAGSPASPTFALLAGSAAFSSAGKAAAPASAPRGVDGRGAGAVDWLALSGKDGGAFKSVFRVNTAGGSAPATCEGLQKGPFEVPYVAEYWFFR